MIKFSLKSFNISDDDTLCVYTGRGHLTESTWSKVHTTMWFIPKVHKFESIVRPHPTHPHKHTHHPTPSPTPTPSPPWIPNNRSITDNCYNSMCPIHWPLAYIWFLLPRIIENIKDQWSQIQLSTVGLIWEDLLFDLSTHSFIQWTERKVEWVFYALYYIVYIVA